MRSLAAFASKKITRTANGKMLDRDNDDKVMDIVAIVAGGLFVSGAITAALVSTYG
jgi:hypothetical protein